MSFKYFKIACCIWFILIFFCTVIHAQEILERSTGWENDPWEKAIGVEFDPSGTQLNIQARGQTSFYTWGAWEKNVKGIDGIIGSIRIDSFQGEGFVALRKYVGTIGDHYIQARVMVQQFGSKTISWVIRERDQNHNTVKNLAHGTFGEYSGEWKVGDTITLGLARVGEEVWLYADGYNCFIKWQPFTEMGPPVLETSITAYIPQGDPSQYIEAVVNNVQLLDIQ